MGQLLPEKLRLRVWIWIHLCLTLELRSLDAAMLLCPAKVLDFFFSTTFHRHTQQFVVSHAPSHFPFVPHGTLIKGYFVLMAITAGILALSIFCELDICGELYNQNYVLSMFLISHSYQNHRLRVFF